MMSGGTTKTGTDDRLPYLSFALNNPDLEKIFMATLFVDCSYLCEHVFLNTGIQRVVRSFLEHAGHIEEKYGTKVVPVRISHGTFTLLRIDDLYEKDPREHSSSGSAIDQKTAAL